MKNSLVMCENHNDLPSLLSIFCNCFSLTKYVCTLHTKKSKKFNNFLFSRCVSLAQFLLLYLVLRYVISDLNTLIPINLYVVAFLLDMLQGMFQVLYRPKQILFGRMHGCVLCIALRVSPVFFSIFFSLHPLKA